jgi:hypothetical protein
MAKRVDFFFSSGDSTIDLIDILLLYIIQNHPFHQSIIIIPSPAKVTHEDLVSSGLEQGDVSSLLHA